ncbi:MAG: hypothetical protein LBG74_05465 [Spirochaetaceae bacterium]|nr:hypothetical protein [Spirochaetaceae bacterium]
MKKHIVYLVIIAFVGSGFWGCQAPVAPRHQNGDELEPENADAQEDYPEDGIEINVTLKVGSTTKIVTTKKGIALIGTFGFSQGGIINTTVWYEEKTNPITTIDDINLIPDTAGQVFIPWTVSFSFLPYANSTPLVISSKAEFSTIDTSTSKIYILADDITGISWSGTDSIPDFKGWFHGGGHTFKNLEFGTGQGLSVALFKKLSGDYARVENFRVLLKKPLVKLESSDFISPVVAEITGGSKAVIKRVAVSMDNPSSSLEMSVRGADKTAAIGGIVASIAGSAEVTIKECAVYLAVSADTGSYVVNAAGSAGRLSIGGIVGEITSVNPVTVRDNYSIGLAKLTGLTAKNSGYGSDYPKYGGGIIGYIGSPLTNSPIEVCQNYTQFDIEISGGSDIDSTQRQKAFISTAGIVGGKNENPDGTNSNAKVQIYANFVMTENLTSVNSNIKGVLFHNTAATNITGYAPTRPNFLYDGIKLTTKTDSDSQAISVVPESSAVITIDGKPLPASSFIEKTYYDTYGWDFQNTWQMGFINPINYTMADMKSLRTPDTLVHYGAYPYPVLRWLGELLPVPMNFKSIAYLKFDAQGFDREGYDRFGYYKEEPYLNREGYDKYGIYGGVSDGIDFYLYDDDKDLAAQCTMPPPGFTILADYYKSNTNRAPIFGDWSSDANRQNKRYDDLAVPRDHGQIQDSEHPKPPAKKIPCPWVDNNKDGYHDVLGYDKYGFNQSGLNIYGYKRDGFHSEGYDYGTSNPPEGLTPEAFNASPFSNWTTGLDKFGRPAPWVDSNTNGFNDISGVDENGNTGTP